MTDQARRRIVIDGSMVTGGGGFTYLVNVIPRLANLSLENRFLVLLRNQNLADSLLAAENVEVVVLPEAGMFERLRFVWFDAANIPLVGNLDANFFEPGARGDAEFWKVDEGDERLWATAGMAVPVQGQGSVGAATPAQSPKYHYPGALTRLLLDTAPRADDGTRRLRYTNPATGGAVMPTLDCYAMRLAAGATTRARRTTWNTICLVVEGAGSSHVGDATFSWEKHDVFTIPHWNWASHMAASADADLFLVTDRSLFEHLDLLREEAQ